MEAVITITGYVGTEVEARAGGAVAKFRLASTPRVKSKGEWGDGATTWIEVACFRSLAEHVLSSVRKGDPVVAVGRLRTNTWEKDGQSFERLVLEAEVVGHDLNRGTSAFRRMAGIRPQVDQEPPPDELETAGPPQEERDARAA